MKRLLPLVIITAVLAAASVGLLAATSASGDDHPPIRSDEGIDPNECNIVHNIDACTAEELEQAGMEVPDDRPPITSRDGIAPDECSLVHNIEACDGGGVSPPKPGE